MKKSYFSAAVLYMVLSSNAFAILNKAYEDEARTSFAKKFKAWQDERNRPEKQREISQELINPISTNNLFFVDRHVGPIALLAKTRFC